MKKIIVGITGASGSIFAQRFIELLLEYGHEIHLVATPNGKKVWTYELDKDFDGIVAQYAGLKGRLILYDNEDLFAQIASGSFRTDAMVIIPCSMGTLAKVAHGISDALITRAADVMIKERRRLVLMTRESPLSSIHLENMLKLSRLGVTIMPPVPAFYHKPKTLAESIDLSIGRLLETLELDNDHHKVWGDHSDR